MRYRFTLHVDFHKIKVIKMNNLSNKSLGFFLILFGGMLFLFVNAYASSSNPYIESFIGRDEIWVVEYHNATIGDMPIPNGNSSIYPGLFFETITKKFASEKWVSVVDSNPMKKDLSRVIIFNFTPSMKEIVIGERKIRVGALSLQLQYYNSDKKIVAFPIPSMPYIFTVPDSSAELIQELNHGVEYLTKDFPKMFSCANKKDANSCR